MSTSQGAWSGVDRRRSQDFGYFKRGGIERRGSADERGAPNHYASWIRFRHDESADGEEDAPRPIEWLLLLFLILLLSALCWSGIAWLVAEIFALF